MGEVREKIEASNNNEEAEKENEKNLAEEPIGEEKMKKESDSGNDIKVDLSGVNETLLVPLCARAIESKKTSPFFIDHTAVKIVEKIDCDLEKHSKSKMNMCGCAARTVIIDREVKKYIKKNPKCSVVNLGAGLDDRFSRVDNGRIHWYNIDFENIIELRKQLIPDNRREKEIAMSALDKRWIEEIENKENVLVIAEGLLMYLKQEDVVKLFNMITSNFKECSIICELMTIWLVKNQKVHDTIKNTSARFTWGITESSDVEKIVPNIELYGDYNITDQMKKMMPVFITLVSPFLRKRNNRIACFKKITMRKFDINKFRK